MYTLIPQSSYDVILMSSLPASAISSSPGMAAASPSTPKHVVVCGGGVIGACTAYFLATAPNASVRVTLVEKSSIACAASGKAGGFLALDWCDDGPLSALARRSFHLHRRLADALDGARSYGYRPLQTLSLTLSPDGDRAAGPASPASDLLPSWVDGSARRVRAIGTAETTAQVHPQLFTRKLVEAAAAAASEGGGGGGVEVLKGEVGEVVVEGGSAVGVWVKTANNDGNGEEEEKIFKADAVVLALGPWSTTSRILSPLLSPLFQISGLKAHSIVLRPRDPAAITPHALFLNYLPAGGAQLLDPEVYPRPSGEVYVCGMSTAVAVPDHPDSITGDPESISMLHEIAGTVSSHLRTRSSGGEGEADEAAVAAVVVAEQACFLPCTEDGVPVIGEVPGVRGCYVGTGHSCWGILNGPATGEALAELILEGRCASVDITPFSPARFNRSRRKFR